MLIRLEEPSGSRSVDALRRQAKPLVSHVADEDGQIVGHVLFSPVILDSSAGTKIKGLAPVAVVPEKQRQGIGSALVREGRERCRALGFDAVVVLGPAQYYPRFGFVAASRWGIRSDYDVPEEYFMALELTPGDLSGKRGTITYHPAFLDV